MSNENASREERGVTGQAISSALKERETLHEGKGKKTGRRNDRTRVKTAENEGRNGSKVKI